ncbi:MAG: B12-binding domain-containing radical SAM protein [Candidatus Aminicenantaceae bacterium]
MKFQLFVPPQGYIAQRWVQGRVSMPPIGILYLASVLRKNSIDTEVVPSDVLNYDWKDVEKRIKEFNPDVVGITTTTENRFESFKLASIAKKWNPNITTVLGGPHISMSGKDTLINIKDVDILVIGEGEQTVAELAQSLREKKNLKNVKGIYFRKNGQISFTGYRNYIDNLDELPFPARDLIPMDQYRFYVTTQDGKRRKAQNIMTSRGCPFNCYFCATPVSWGRKVRGHSPERVIEEIEHLIDTYKAEFIWFYDDTLNYNSQRLNKIMDLIIERKLNIKFCNEFRIDIIDEPTIEKMAKAGLVWAHFGIEAGNARIRNHVVQKNINIEKAYQFVRWGKKYGFVPDAFFIFSHHTENWTEAQETIEIMERFKSINPETEISSAILHIYPGTELEKIAKKNGILPENFSWSKKSDMKKVSILPAAQGYVPLFKEKLNWFQIADLVMRWSTSEKKVMSANKIKSALKSIISLKDLYVYFVFLVTLFKHKLIKIFRKPDKEKEKTIIKKPDVGMS